MKVLIACEYSGKVRDAFLRCGHDAVSCDLLPSDKPGPHMQADVVGLLEMGWDLLVAFPPCTYLCSSGLHWNTRRPERARHTEDALKFVRLLLDAPITKIALENPIGCISSRIRKPDQIVQPWQFGHPESKSTCLWLKGLPLLKPTKIAQPGLACRCGHRFEFALGKYGCPNCNGDSGPAEARWDNQTASGQNRLAPSPDRWKLRSETYSGIADAMAAQWEIEGEPNV